MSYIRHIPFNNVWYYVDGKDKETKIYNAIIVGHHEEDGVMYYYLDIEKYPYKEGGWIRTQDKIGPIEYGKYSVVRYVADILDNKKDEEEWNKKEIEEKYRKEQERIKREKKKNKPTPKDHKFF